MKKLILALAIGSFAFAAQAQNEGYSKGNTFLTGSLSISSENDKDDQYKTSSFNFSPAVGHFISDNIAVGVGIGIGSNKGESTATGGTVEVEESIFTVGGFGRYYFTPKSRFSMFGHLGINYATATDKTTDPDAKVNGMDIFAAPGVNYFISNKLSLEAVIGRIGYTSVKADADGAKGATKFDFGMNLSSISFGINYKF